ncbi:uncharacterized protein [Primulina eburnea]|uniref:uncharacterized protein n=1 Tax=Primulina eburnea TaxID=1245227 RepID=UPI003C6C6A4F
MRDGDQARCAIYMLRDDASLWWEGAAHAFDLATLTWAMFKKLFYEKYFPADVRGQLTREFMSLRQVDLYMTEFIRKFDRGCHFVPMIAGDAAEKLRHFLDGLKPNLCRDVMLMRPASYDEDISCAFQAEQALRDIEFELQRNRHSLSTVSSYRRNSLSGSRDSRGNRSPKGRLGRQNSSIRDLLRQKGHKAADYPKSKGPTTGRAYVMHAEEADAALDSTLNAGIILVEMDSGFRVSILSRDQMFTSRIVRGSELRLQQKAVQADLIVLLLPEFDIILGMDCLSSHGALIDFRQSSVSVRPPSVKPFVFEVARHQQFPHVISCLCARKLIKRGWQAFLASIVSVTDLVRQRLEDVDVVREFSSVYPDDVSGIPPDREADFSIELMPGTVPISKACYRLAPAEMKEPKDQIQDLLDGIEVDPSKVEVVRDWPVPKSMTEIRSFLGLAGYYRKFIQNFFSIAVPMTTLTKKNAKFIWGSECQDGFDRLKRALTTTPVLAMPIRAGRVCGVYKCIEAWFGHRSDAAGQSDSLAIAEA